MNNDLFRAAQMMVQVERKNRKYVEAALLLKRAGLVQDFVCDEVIQTMSEEVETRMAELIELAKRS